MKILILGTFVEGSLENYYLDGLKKAGHDLIVFECNSDYYDKISKNSINKILNHFYSDLFFKKINYNLLNFVKNKNFDVILVFKGMTLFPDSVCNLKKNCKLLLNYNPDHPFKYYSKGSGNLNVKNSLQFYDIVITYSKKIKNQITDDYNLNSEVLPFGHSLLYENMQINSLRNGVKFIGAFDLDRFNILNKLNVNNLQIYGDDKWGKFKSIKGKSDYYKNRKLYGDDFISEIQSSNSVINILRKQNIVEDSHNMRTFEVPALGGVLISNYTEEQASFYEPEKEMLYFKDVDELNSKIEFLIHSPKNVNIISRNAFLRSKKSNYSYYHRSLQLIEIINLYI